MGTRREGNVGLGCSYSTVTFIFIVDLDIFVLFTLYLKSNINFNYTQASSSAVIILGLFTLSNDGQNVQEVRLSGRVLASGPTGPGIDTPPGHG